MRILVTIAQECFYEIMVEAPNEREAEQLAMDRFPCDSEGNILRPIDHSNPEVVKLSYKDL